MEEFTMNTHRQVFVSSTNSDPDKKRTGRNKRKDSTLPAVFVATVRSNHNIFDDADALIAIAQNSFTKTAKNAVDENDQLGIPTHGSINGKLEVHHSPGEYTLT